MNFQIEIRGVVQGVGFRPFIYNLAHSHDLKGSVLNDGFGVVILLQCSQEDVDQFIREIELQKPPLSRIDSIELKEIESDKKFSSFEILKSKTTSKLSLEIPSDVGMCKECQGELEDENNRRFRYPFINCVNCGPRFSIIKNLPYDRKNTSMSEFLMCTKCQDEYENPKDRRYHAQPIGCFDCGVKLSLFDSTHNKIICDDMVDKVISFLAEGKILAIKGIGGYHLVCDATNDKSVKLLREKKNRISKPFAVMVKDMKMAKTIAEISLKEEELLESQKRPIVLLRKIDGNSLSDSIAPFIEQIGLFLPYTPLHHLILQKLDTPIVATSANISGEPLCTTREEILRLSHIWDYCLDNDRDIVNSCDDSVVFVENDISFMLRDARGYAPSYLKLPHKTDKKILALGANQKSTVAITIEDKVILSPYIGDLDSLSSIEYFKSHIDTLKRIYHFEPDIVVCDKHPNYESTKYAKELKAKNPNIELIEVQHHYAHILATMGINNITKKVLGVSFDGTGYGDGGNLWGGEFFVCDAQSYERVGHFKEFKLLGGERAIKEPRRVGLSFLFELYGEDVFEMDNPILRAFTLRELKTLYTVWKKGLNSPLSSSCGRLFDCVASLLDVIQVCSYEGESGLMLESLYDENIKDFYPFKIKNGVIDFHYIVNYIVIEKNNTIAVSKFFNTLVEIIYEMGEKYKLPIVLGGGVFQNRVLLRLIMRRIPNVIVPKDFVSNDSAIAYGQAIAAVNRL